MLKPVQKIRMWVRIQEDTSYDPGYMTKSEEDFIITTHNMMTKKQIHVKVLIINDKEKLSAWYYR